MAINKNFVVKNGLEVATNLIVADSTTKKVGIASTSPRFDFEVRGGIGATDLILSGIGTFENQLRVGSNGSVLTALGIGGSVGIGTTLPSYLLDIRSPVSTGQTALYVYGDVRVSGDLNVDDINFDQASVSNLFVTGIGTIVSLASSVGIVTDLSGTNINYTGIGTILSLVSSVGIITNLNGTNVNYTGFGTITTFNSTTGTITNLGVTNGSVTNLNGTNINYAGIGTISTFNSTNGNITNLNGTNVNYTGIGTVTTLNSTTGTVTNLSGTNVNYTGIGTIATLNSTTGTVTNLSGTDLNYTGVGTFGNLTISSGIVTATSGIVTYYGDGRYLQNIISGVGINTASGNVGYGATILDFRGPGISTVTVSSGIATINISGGGGGSVSISSVAPTSPSNGDLWYNIDYGRTFVYYDEVTLGVGTTAVWVDAAPFNVGIITSLTNVSFNPGTVSSPSIYFIGDQQTGFFSPSSGNVTFVSAGSSVLNINSSGVVVTGIATAQDFDSLSDINHKENIETISDALLKVEQLRGVKFDWKESGLPSYGVIAQELQEILPELVHGDNPKTVNYNGIIGVLIEAVKELSSEVQELKDQLNK